MKIKAKIALLLASIISGVGILMVPAITSAAVDTCTWTGVINANWSNGGNWTGCDNGGVPQNGDSLIFAGGTTSSNNDMAALSIATLSISAAQTISGNAFTITGGFSNSTAAAVINADITLGGNQSFASTASGSILLAGNLNMNGFNLTLFMNGGSMNSTGVISGAGQLLKSGTNQLTLQGNNTFSGNFLVTGGFVSIYNSNALGSTAGTTTVSSGATVNIFATGLTIPENITIDGSGNVGGGALRNFTGASTWSGDITIGAVNTAIYSTSGLFLDITGHVSGAGVLDLSGKVKLSNSNTVLGAYSPIGSATIYVNGTNTSNYNLNGSTLNGSGSIATLNASAGVNVINPGNDAAGTLSVGNTTLNATTTLNIELRSGTSDTLAVNGTVNLANAILVTDLDYNAPAGTQFTIVNNDGADAVTGIFAGKVEGATFTTGGAFGATVSISYVGGTGNDVVITVVTAAVAAVTPTPSTPAATATVLANTGSPILVSILVGISLVGFVAAMQTNVFAKKRL